MKITENQVAGNAPAKNSRPAYMPDDRPLTARQVATVRNYANLLAYRERVAARPAVISAMKAEGLIT